MLELAQLAVELNQVEHILHLRRGSPLNFVQPESGDSNGKQANYFENSIFTPKKFSIQN